MAITTVSDKYQVVIPKAVREKLDIQKGQKLIAYIIDSCLILSPSSSSYTQKLAGLGQKLWAKIDPIEYVRKERQEWEKK